ncbi:inositol monophosphatase family protein [Candidatus Omnitrophota bacterium]
MSNHNPKKTVSQQEKDLLFETACEAARKSGEILKKYFGKKKEISFKSRIDPVTNVDLQSEEIIIAVIKTRYPDHDIITEESDFEQSGSPFRWIIDPLDGTVNFSHDYPFVSVSIALEIDGEIEIGVVYNPIWEEFFTARRGGGAFCNETRISVSDIDILERSLLATGFSYDVKENPYNNIAHFSHLMMHAQALRRDGSAALNMCYCAMGRFDGYWEIRIHPWDIAAGSLIITEAGGVVTALDGGPLPKAKNQILASNGRIHDQLVEQIQVVQQQYKEISL